MNKEEIYVVIDSEEKQKRAVQILTIAKEIFYSGISDLDVFKDYPYLHLNEKGWSLFRTSKEYNQINLDQLEQLLNPDFVVSKVILPMEELRQQAERYGFELVEKAKEIKVGDFGIFWDSTCTCPVYGYLQLISKGVYCYSPTSGSSYRNFRHLTDAEKLQITENW